MRRGDTGTSARWKRSSSELIGRGPRKCTRLAMPSWAMDGPAGQRLSPDDIVT